MQFWNKEVYGRYVKHMHLPRICPTSSQSSISKCMGLYYKMQRTYRQRLDNQKHQSGLQEATSYRHTTAVALFPTLDFMVFKYQSLQKKKKTTEDKCECDYFFCHKNADKEPCTSIECQNSPSIPAAFEAFI